MLNSKEMNGQNCTYNVIYKQTQKKSSHFYCSRACCWGPAPPWILPTSPSKLAIFFSVATPVTLSIAFLQPIGDTCKSHVNVNSHCDKIYHQLMATQVKFPRKSLAIDAAHSLRHTFESRPKTIGANFEHFGPFVGPNLLGSIASKWIFKTFNSWGKSMQCIPWAVISNNNTMVGTINNFLMNWEFNSQKFQQISIKFLSFFGKTFLELFWAEHQL